MKYSLLTFSFVLCLFVGHLSANPACAKCRIIESEREAQGPQDAGYYDDSHHDQITPNQAQGNPNRINPENANK